LIPKPTRSWSKEIDARKNVEIDSNIDACFEAGIGANIDLESTTRCY